MNWSLMWTSALLFSCASKQAPTPEYPEPPQYDLEELDELDLEGLPEAGEDTGIEDEDIE